MVRSRGALSGVYAGVIYLGIQVCHFSGVSKSCQVLKIIGGSETQTDLGVTAMGEGGLEGGDVVNWARGMGQ